MKWHRFRNDRTPDRRRRGDCIHRLEFVVAGTIGPTSATFVDLLDGCLVQNPSVVELTNSDLALTEVVVLLLNDTSHDLFEAGQLVFEVLQSIMKNVDLGILLSDHLTKVATLTKS